MKIINNLEHLLYTMLLVVIGYSLGNPVLAVWIVAMFFVGREHAQAEYRWIEHYGKGLRANMPWWATLDKRVWDFHSWFWNLTLPIAVAIITSFLMATNFKHIT